MVGKKNLSGVKEANPVDVHVGNQIRIRRMLMKITQSDLGAQVGVTFQQIQKYELGKNRVSASRLQTMASILGVPVAYFFTGLRDRSEPQFDKQCEDDVARGRLTAEAIQFNEAYLRIRSHELRTKIVALVVALAVKDQSE
ncbi:hypothetical protein BJF93_11160 [Xaviernesmea oryzae]|uniref:HTH cro/C1-type domain-containing protein n=1 Tax=Xaviernesmea oryzae TaxID=464029 RepID=A0A1Q9AVY5_9HYPH|nr:helix-turn-helix transcriptional regulator [Xaviernesmea oryzae]OLP59630.1 hypothetical protein BJF93_11160 [Xaviernesmea oryzae]SEM24464.1 Transcriptional regulator, contains XRE-family HTH domain [Xaviernesmea oryzae]